MVRGALGKIDYSTEALNEMVVRNYCHSARHKADKHKILLFSSFLMDLNLCVP